MAHRSWTDVRAYPRWAVVPGALLALTWVVPVHAQVADAEKLMSSGIALRRDHKNAEALDLYRQAWALAPSPRVQAHMGLAEQALGQWLEAERDIRAALGAEG